MKQNVKISIASEKDIPELSTLLELLFSLELEFTPNSETQQRGLLRIIQNPQVGFILVGKVKGLTVSMVNILFTISTALGERVAILEDMVVASAFRGWGIGNMLMEYAIKEARRQQCKRITLLTDSSNEIAKKFYQKHGFSKSTMMPLRLSLLD